MAFEKLNHEEVIKRMRRALMRPADLAKSLKTDRQTVNYILHWGGRKYAADLAKIFGCKKEDLLIANRDPE